MSPRELHRAVARATGESVARIERLGFRLAESEATDAQMDADDEESEPQFIDWDALDAARHATTPWDAGAASPLPAEREVCGANS